MKLNFSISGDREFKARMAEISGAIADEAARVLNAEHETIMEEAKRRTPVDTGALRASGHVNPPERQGAEVVSEGGFGGGAIDYAVHVHEDLEARHTVGQAKFYESVLLERSRDVGERLAEAIRRGLE